MFSCVEKNDQNAKSKVEETLILKSKIIPGRQRNKL